MSFHLPFGKPYVPAHFIRRLNRFLVEVSVKGKAGPVLAHLHDPGRLKELLLPDALLYLEPADKTSGPRKTAFTAALVKSDDVLVSINSILPNRFVEACLRAGAIHEFRDYTLASREVRHGRSRFDFHLMGAGIDILLEVKSVTLVQEGSALFPDAPTTRGTRHLRELLAARHQGYCGSVLFIVQRDDACELRPHRIIDPVFASTLQDVMNQGIEVVAYTSRLSLTGITLGRRIPLNFPG